MTTVTKSTPKAKASDNAKADAAALLVNDAELLAFIASFSETVSATTAKADEIIVLSGNRLSVSACQKALADALADASTSSVTMERVTAALADATVRQGMTEALAKIDKRSDSYGKDCSMAYETVKLEAAKASGLWSKPPTKAAQEAKTNDTAGKKRIHNLCQVATLYDGLRWLRQAVESSKRETGGILVACFTSFARFRPMNNQWRLVNPARSGEGVDDTLTMEESAKLAKIFTDWSDKKLLTTNDVSAAMRAAGLKPAQAVSAPPDDKADDDKADKADKASGTGAPVSVDFSALGANATADQAIEFIVAFLTPDKVSANKVGAVKLATAFAKAARASGIGS